VSKNKKLAVIYWIHIMSYKKNKEDYDEYFKDKRNNMIDFIKNSKYIIVNKHIYQPKWPNDPCFFPKYNKVKYEMDITLNEDGGFYILINGIKNLFKISVRSGRWYSGRDYIEYNEPKDI
jgi:hypothetical protein